jgi:protein kinase C substrate 80K-H
MAVLAAVRDYEAFAGLQHINDVRSSADEQGGEVKVKTEEEEVSLPEGDDEKKEEKKEGELWTADELAEKLDIVLAADHEALLLEHDKHVGTSDSAQDICGWHVSSLYFASEIIHWSIMDIGLKSVNGELT